MIALYKELAKKILQGRKDNSLSEQDEDIILDKMEYLWKKMSEEDRRYINSLAFDEEL